MSAKEAGPFSVAGVERKHAGPLQAEATGSVVAALCVSLSCPPTCFVIALALGLQLEPGAAVHQHCGKAHETILQLSHVDLCGSKESCQMVKILFMTVWSKMENIMVTATHAFIWSLHACAGCMDKMLTVQTVGSPSGLSCAKDSRSNLRNIYTCPTLFTL